jgi:hypothetical protein
VCLCVCVHVCVRVCEPLCVVVKEPNYCAGSVNTSSVNRGRSTWVPKSPSLQSERVN